MSGCKGVYSPVMSLTITVTFVMKHSRVVTTVFWGNWLILNLVKGPVLFWVFFGSLLDLPKGTPG